MIPSKFPYNTRSQENILSDTDNKLQPTVLSARLLKPNHGFFINNIRAVHAVYTAEPGKMRISFSVTVNVPIRLMPRSLQEVIVRSAEKYSDHALLWTPPV
jgi:hypothetical protein